MSDLHKPWLVKELMVSDHALERFRVRARRGAELTNNMIMGVMQSAIQNEKSGSCLVLEDGAALRWLIPVPNYKVNMVVRPWAAEGPPIVLTVITNEMREAAFAKKKYKGVQP